jgi:transcriptional regulator with XRE-family HTH domain
MAGMDEDGGLTELAVLIGTRVRHHRQSRRWTLDQLAEVAGVSRRAVVNVEQGTANPSVATLLRLSDALGIGLPALVEPPATATALRVVRAADAAELWTGDHGGRGVLVAGSRAPDVLELWDWSLAPGDRHATEAHAAGTRELVHVLQGRLTIQVATSSVTLTRGDAASFHGDEPHSYANEGTTTVRFSLAVFEPGVGPADPAGDRNG